MDNVRKWYVMRFLYNRKADTLIRMETDGVEHFIPLRYEMQTRKGRKVRVAIPVIRDLVFVHSTRKILTPYLATNDHFQFQFKRGGEPGEALVVPDDQMQTFMEAVRVSLNPMYFAPQELQLAKGTWVLIHGGEFDGMEGRLMKVKGARSKRLIIELPDALCVAVEVRPDLVEVIEKK